MTPEQFAALKKGDIVRHKLASEAMTVKKNCGQHGVLVERWARMTNPDEWLLIGDDGHPRPEPRQGGIIAKGLGIIGE